MELKTARLTLLIDPNKKAAFERLCAAQDRTASQVVRQLIRNYLAHHGVEYLASGALAEEAEPGRQKASRPMKQDTQRTAAPAAKRPATRRKA